jgi:hypothetical protein
MHDVVVRWVGSGWMRATSRRSQREDGAAWVVPLVIGTVLSVSGVVIFGRVPSILDGMLAEAAAD